MAEHDDDEEDGVHAGASPSAKSPEITQVSRGLVQTDARVRNKEILLTAEGPLCDTFVQGQAQLMGQFLMGAKNASRGNLFG